MEITYSGVVEASNQVKTTANTIKGQLDDLNKRVEAVVATWDGETQRAFHDRHAAGSSRSTTCTRRC